MKRPFGSDSEAANGNKTQPGEWDDLYCSFKNSQ